jgi:hypothetical protein
MVCQRNAHIGRAPDDCTATVMTTMIAATHMAGSYLGGLGGHQAFHSPFARCRTEAKFFHFVQCLQIN